MTVTIDSNRFGLPLWAGQGRSADFEAFGRIDCIAVPRGPVSPRSKPE